MPEMLGNNFLPSSITSARRRFREKVTELREPVKRFREQNIPGPDVIGKTEEQMTSLRDDFVRRESVLSSIKDRASGSNGGSNSSSDETNEMV